jgi:hypothetical protein
MRYAHNQHIHEMRDLLIEFGAANGEAELERWDRLNIDRFEPKFMRDFHRSAVLFRLPSVYAVLRYPTGALYSETLLFALI